MPTLGLDFATKKHQLKDGTDVNMKIWDTAGQERFKNITTSFYKKADGIIIVYDVTDRKTFQGVETWIESIKQNASEKSARILVGNKIDLEDKRVIS